jgi:hypothetical protein
MGPQTEEGVAESKEHFVRNEDKVESFRTFSYEPFPGLEAGLAKQIRFCL